jgi:hypothetical protein
MSVMVIQTTLPAVTLPARRARACQHRIVVGEQPQRPTMVGVQTGGSPSTSKLSATCLWFCYPGTDAVALIFVRHLGVTRSGGGWQPRLEGNSHGVTQGNGGPHRRAEVGRALIVSMVLLGPVSVRTASGLSDSTLLKLQPIDIARSFCCTASMKSMGYRLSPTGC